MSKNVVSEWSGCLRPDESIIQSLFYRRTTLCRDQRLSWAFKVLISREINTVSRLMATVLGSSFIIGPLRNAWHGKSNAWSREMTISRTGELKVCPIPNDLRTIRRGQLIVDVQFWSLEIAIPSCTDKDRTSQTSAYGKTEILWGYSGHVDDTDIVFSLNVSVDT